MRHQQPVKLVTAVERSDEINIALVDGAQQALDPFRLDGGGFGRDHGAGGDAQQFGRSQNGAQRGAGRRAAGIFRADAVQGAQGVQVGGVLQIVDRSSADQVRSLIARAAIGVHDYRAFPGKILQQAGTDGLHHLTDGGGIVVGGHTYKNVRLTDVDQLAKKLIRKNAFLGQIVPPLVILPDDLRLRSCADGTNRTGMGPGSGDKATPRPGEKCFGQTSRSEYSL